jgi:hypothetical protein
MAKTTGLIADQPPRDGREWDNRCARCGSDVDFTECYNCEDGYSHHDCGEDCCCCLHPEPNVRCDICHGVGGWWECLSSRQWCEANPLPGREDVKRGQVEWFLIEKPPAGRGGREGR